MVFLKSFGVSIITGIITEIFKITLLKITSDPNKTIVYSSIFSYIIAYQTKTNITIIKQR